MEEVAKWPRSVQLHYEPQSDLSITHYSTESKELNIEELKTQLRNRHRKSEEFTYISVKIDKQHILKGEVLLHDLNELYPDLQ
ncbi:hypothetical protein R0J90_14700, partial [Micrococcus sp. SIMBA_144]